MGPARRRLGGVLDRPRRDCRRATTPARLTRERWLLPLFSELGYGRLVQQPGVEIDGKTLPVFYAVATTPDPPRRRRRPARPSHRRASPAPPSSHPHGLVQELLNRSDEHLWGIVTNGLRCGCCATTSRSPARPTSSSTSRRCCDGEVYADFALLWLVRPPVAARGASARATAGSSAGPRRRSATGTRALGELRDGVEEAIEALGRGFLAHPANAALHDALRDGSARRPGLLPRAAAPRLPAAVPVRRRGPRRAAARPTTARRSGRCRERYDAYYSTARLRRSRPSAAAARATRPVRAARAAHAARLHDGGQPVARAPAARQRSLDPDTDGAPQRCASSATTTCSRRSARSPTSRTGGRRPVDYRNLGAEELGSVYESLLELHPEIDRETATLHAHDRRRQRAQDHRQLLHADEPHQRPARLRPRPSPRRGRRRPRTPRQALLDLTVCDPACGSGHFLIAAAHRIAKRLAAVRTRRRRARARGDPTRPARRHRPLHLRRRHQPDGGRAVQGVLWLEALEPGQAAVLPRPPHPARQQPARHHARAARRRHPRRGVQAARRRRQGGHSPSCASATPPSARAKANSSRTRTRDRRSASAAGRARARRRRATTPSAHAGARVRGSGASQLTTYR